LTPAGPAKKGFTLMTRNPRIRFVAPPAAAIFVIAVLLAAVTLLLVAGLTRTAGGQAQVAAVRQATAAFHDLSAAEAAGYGAFHVCTHEPGVGTMGQHFANGGLVGDSVVDALQPEVLVYEPKANGGFRLVAIEYVVFAAAWDAENASPPQLFGRTFSLIGEPNRYGLPPFYELHVWLWEPNPSGMFADWNPKVTCEHAEV
jgi:hypothetical protein